MNFSMMQYHTNKILGFVLVILFSFSCSSNLDFNQINDFKSEPVYIANLTYFDILAIYREWNAEEYYF
jgi:hypothetical protein